jgi:hypothetical protein
MDDAKLNLRNLGVKIWRTRALDIAEWASVVREGKCNFKGGAVLKKMK